MSGHGGKRDNAGRKKGSGMSKETRDLFRDNATSAINSIVAIASDPSHQHHFKACELVLNRAYGQGASVNTEAIMQSFIDGEINAIRAGLLIEAVGGKVQNQLLSFINAEKKKQKSGSDFLAPTNYQF